jgi:hypothetical protein
MNEPVIKTCHVTEERPPSDPDAVIWMLDLHDRWPWRAHQIVAVENRGGRGEVRITACGQRETEWSHREGWWALSPGSLPLVESQIHCRADVS